MPTLGAWLDDFLEQRKRARYRNVKTERVLVRTHFASDPVALIRVGTESLTPQVLQAFWRRLVARRATTPRHVERAGPARPLSRSSVANVLTLLRTALEQAVQAGLLEHNPARGLSVPRVLGATTDLELEGVLEADEESAVLRALAERDDAVTYAMVRFALGSGVRRGELLSLRWRDVDLDAAVPFAIVRDSGRGKVTAAAPPKGGAARRVPLFGAALDAVRDLAAKPHRRSPWVFPGARGGRRKLPPVAELREALRAVGVKRHVRWHDLRHTCATALLEGTRAGMAPWPIEAVQQLLGHASVTTTERYVHARGARAFAAARAAERVVHPTRPEASCDSGGAGGRRFCGIPAQVPASVATSRDQRTPLRPLALRLPLVEQPQAGVAGRKQVAMLPSALTGPSGTRERTGSRVLLAERDTGLEAECHSTRSRVPELRSLGTAACSHTEEAAAVSNDQIDFHALREQLKAALEDQVRVLVRYWDRRHEEAATSGVVVECDSEVAVILPGPSAPPRRIRLSDVYHVETLEQPGGAS